MKVLENVNGEVKVILSDRLMDSGLVSIFSDRKENHVVDTIFLTKSENEADKPFPTIINGTYISPSTEIQFMSGDICEDSGSDCDFICGFVPEQIDCWSETFRHELRLRNGIAYIDIDDSDGYIKFIISVR